MTCTICGHELKNSADMQKVRDRGARRGELTGVRCVQYEACMVRAERNRREEIGAPPLAEVKANAAG